MHGQSAKTVTDAIEKRLKESDIMTIRANLNFVNLNTVLMRH